MVPGGVAGGVEQFVLGLVRSLGRLDDGPEEYVIVAHPAAKNWLRDELGPRQQLVPGPEPEPRQGLARRVRRRLTPTLRSGSFYESLGADVVHFPYQSYVPCRLATVYNPHDLQHRHYPEFFPRQQLAWRERVHGLALARADAIAAESRWVRDDVVSEYGVEAGRIYVIPRGSPTDLYGPVGPEKAAAVRRDLDLPTSFALYPAQTWPHKNHLRLVEALALLRDRDRVDVQLVCTGRQTPFWGTVEERIRELRLEDRVRHLGFVEAEQLRALYRLADLVVLPSLFEGGGFPVLEAFREGTPVACSALTALPEIGGDAVLLFDPTSVDEIASALRRLSENGRLRDELRERGRARIQLFDWSTTVRSYRALYRRIARLAPTAEDEELLRSALA